MCDCIFLEGHMTTSRCSLAIVTVLLTVMIAAPHMTAQVPGGATKPSLTAKLIDAEKKAATRSATVEVTTVGVELVDPALSMEKAVTGQGHLHYQLDKGPVIATPSAKLSFHELTPGAHTIVVMLAGNDHKPLGPQQTLNVTIPKPMTTVATPAAATPEKKSGY
jgi:hypothetical protein